MILNLFMLLCVVCPIVFFPCLWFHACILISNECIYLQLLGWDTPFYFFIPSMFRALGLHPFYSKRSNRYKDKDEGGGMHIPPNTMESDSMTTFNRIALLSLETMLLGGRRKGGPSDKRPTL